MWKSGREVISRSSAVSSIQYGKPTPAIAYARWVCMTSLDLPVVPEVGIGARRGRRGPTLSSNGLPGLVDVRHLQSPSSASRSSQVTVARYSAVPRRPGARRAQRR